ncbi:MAG TPA: glycoside hydrolase family 5 protein [Caulobacteraceae bacterium]|jgi:endoglucanase
MTQQIHSLLMVAVAALLSGLMIAARGLDTDASPAPLDAYDQARAMGRGVNVLGYDPIWNDPQQGRFRPEHFRAIARGGFQTVRMNLQPWSHMDADERLDPQWLATLDRLVTAATDNGLTVVIDDHDDEHCVESIALCESRLTAFWSQIAPHFAKAPDKVVFELLNEPHGKLDDAAWNRLLDIELSVVRETNPTRNVVIGPTAWNSFDHLPGLRLPETDRHIIVTVHYYTPMEFTHQGAAWVAQYAGLKDVHWGTDAEIARVGRDFDTIAAWSKAHHRPIFLGEFGAYDKADMASRVRYTSTVARAAEARGWAWAYWQFDSDFIAWDMQRNAWVAPIHKALIPGG